MNCSSTGSGTSPFQAGVTKHLFPSSASNKFKMEKTRPVYQLDTPFSSVEWPKISQEDQDSILNLLCNLLSPIGQHRKAYIQPSKGKRSKAQKRKRAHDDENEPQADRHAPPPPAVADSVDIGLATITRTLQELSAEATDRKPTSEDKAESKSVEPYSIVFILRSGVPTAFFNHLPQMVAVSCESLQLAEPTRLVGFSKSCETRLSSCLGIPRVTSVALRGDGTPQARAVVDFVRKTVPVIEVPWLKIAEKRQFQETTINTIQAPVGKKRQKKT